jgi:hypothetical protein
LEGIAGTGVFPLRMIVSEIPAFFLPPTDASPLNISRELPPVPLLVIIELFRNFSF